MPTVMWISGSFVLLLRKLKTRQECTEKSRVTWIPGIF
uniref:Uncharacterized protein n=1 Tax=Arundo donax TaxID=35708 RepID=A0A0A9EDM2_ARUDO